MDAGVNVRTVVRCERRGFTMSEIAFNVNRLVRPWRMKTLEKKIRGEDIPDTLPMSFDFS